MIQYYLDLEKEVTNIKAKALTSGQVQKIYSTAYYISLSIRAPGKTWHLFLGRGAGHEGIWLHEAPPPSELRRKDTFLEYLRRHITACSFLDVTVDKSDRIIKLDYQKFGERQSFLFFWKGRKLYFSHYYQDNPGSSFKLLLSWRGKSFVPGSEIIDLFDYFDEVGRHHEMDHDRSASTSLTMSELLENERKLAVLKDSGKNPNFLERKKENIIGDLRKAKQWKKLQSVLDKGEILENIYELKIADQKIKFKGDLNPYERRNLLFEKIKKLKRGEAILTERLDKVEEQISGKVSTAVKQSTTQIIRPVWGEEKSKNIVNSATVRDEYKILKFEKFQIGVGLNSQGNDQLRNKWANRDDYWLHLDGLKSSHVIIKLQGAEAVDTELLNLASTILAQFSQFNDDWIPIVYTQVKNLKGVSGAPGMVTYKKEKHLVCSRVDLKQVIKE